MADKEQYHLSKPAEWIDKVVAGAVIGTEPMPNLSNQFKAQFRENIGAADATAKWQPLGFFDTVEELEATITNPAPGDAYAVGVEEPFNIWVWDGVGQRWRNGGNMKGMDGKDGSDANVTAENIIAALGYIPADAENVGVPDGSIGTAQLANGAVTAEKLAPNIDLGGLAMDKVWENASPSSTFSAQLVSLNLEQNNRVGIDFARLKSNRRNIYVELSVGDLGVVTDVVTSANSYPYVTNRTFTCATTGIDFDDGLKQTCNSNARATDNDVLIPMRIYVIKGAR